MSLFDGEEPALTAGSTIVVTGANGFIGSHVCDQLLRLNYRVIGTVRDTVRCQWIANLYEQKYPGQFRLAEIPDLTISGALNHLLENAAGLAHVATEAMSSNDPNVSVTATVRSTVHILKSAAESRTMKRLVLTSSSAAVYTPNPNAKNPKLVTSNDWNLDSVARAWAPPPYESDRYFDVYAACKAQSEYELWKVFRELDSELVINTVAPDSNFGPPIAPNARASTGKIIYSAWQQSDGSLLRPFAAGKYRWFIDVRDTARLHVAALLDSAIRGERLLGYAHKFSGHDLVEFFEAFNQEKGESRAIKPPIPEDFICVDDVETSRSIEALRRLGRDGWTARNETLRESLDT